MKNKIEVPANVLLHYYCLTINFYLIIVKRDTTRGHEVWHGLDTNRPTLIIFFF